MVAISTSKIPDGIFITCGSLFGSLIFSTTITISIITIYNTKNFISIPTRNFIKDLIFLGIGVLIIFIYGNILYLNFFYVVLLFCYYLLYLTISIKCFKKLEEDNIYLILDDASMINNKDKDNSDFSFIS